MKNIVLFLVFCCSAAQAQVNDDAVKITKMDVFKNGTVFVVSEGRIRLTDGIGSISGIPEAAFGTLWIAPMDKSIQVEELKAVHEKKATKKKR